nr:PREDICTED: cysteine/serine-rich nuclear protein 2 [Struthio camelus australis]
MGPSALIDPSLPSATSILKRQKQLRRKNVRFDQVTVYYFARRQGFTSVPSQGGSSLGMAQRHNSVRRYTLCEFAQEQEVNHREILREHLKEEKLHAKKMKGAVTEGRRQRDSLLPALFFFFPPPRAFSPVKRCEPE